MIQQKISFLKYPFFVFSFWLPCAMLISSFVIPDERQKALPGVKTHKPMPQNLSFGKSPYYIVIDKSDYELKVYDKLGWYATYPIVFGSKDLSDKMREGDKRTPTGTFKIILKKIHKKWGQELLLDYPNEESYRKFRARKSQGLIPANASIGGGIAIHATRPEEEWTVDKYYNWTDGCVSVKYSEMKELYRMIPTGTVVKIQP